MIDAALNFVCFLVFIATVLAITADGPDGGHGAKRRGDMLVFAV